MKEYNNLQAFYFVKELGHLPIRLYRMDEIRKTPNNSGGYDMGNMSYCKFQNTVQDLRDCRQTLVNMESGGDDPLSERELEAAKELASECRMIVEILCQDEWKSITDDIMADNLQTMQDELKELCEEDEDDEIGEWNQPPIDSGKPFNER